MSRFAMQYPEGSIKTSVELRELIKQAKMGWVTLHAVEQSGYMSGFVLTEESEYILNPNMERTPGEVGLCIGPSFNRITCFKTYGDFDDPHQWNWLDFIIGSYNIDDPTDNGCGVHRLFTDRKLAEAYSEELKNDPEYIEEVRQHHKWCAELFSDHDYYWDEHHVDEAFD